jgi:hypothetical protein
MASWLGVGNLLVLLQLATLPADLTRQNQELFAREVMPHLRTLDGAAHGSVQPGTGA